MSLKQIKYLSLSLRGQEFNESHHFQQFPALAQIGMKDHHHQRHTPKFSKGQQILPI